MERCTAELLFAETYVPRNDAVCGEKKEVDGVIMCRNAAENLFECRKGFKL